MCHQYNKTFETGLTGLSDFHKMIYTMLKSKFIKLPPKVYVYRDFQYFDENELKKEAAVKLQTMFQIFLNSPSF